MYIVFIIGIGLAILDFFLMDYHLIMFVLG
jgi:hypothetical protein